MTVKAGGRNVDTSGDSSGGERTARNLADLQRYRDLLETTLDWVWEMRVDGRHTYSSPQLQRILGYSAEEFLPLSLAELFHPDDLKEVEKRLPEHIAARSGWRSWVVRMRHKDGGYRYLESSAAPVIAPDGAFWGWRGVDRDITDRKRVALETNRRLAAQTLLGRISSSLLAGSDEVLDECVQAALRELAAFYELTHLALGWFDGQRAVVRWSHHWGPPGGPQAPDEVSMQRMPWMSSRLLAGQVVRVDRPEDVPPGAPERALLASLGRGALLALPISVGQSLAGVCAVVADSRPQGWAQSAIAELQVAAGLLATAVARARAEAALAEQAERLRQSQKMDAVGRLAGGVAHDFNNQLTAILGFTHLALEEVLEGMPARAELEAILNAAEQAAASTRQLLAFGRKQVLQPRAVDLNALVRKFDQSVGRLLGEHCQVVLRLDPRTPLVHVDPTQLEQALLNLCINARDAMPHGGTLTLETRPAESAAERTGEPPAPAPGSHAQLVVRDTGVGIDAAMASQVFEPFFTTKPEGQGTGLGLSMVHGFVTQSGGSIRMTSEPGAGTTFHLRLPATDAEPAAEVAHCPPAAGERASETILVVEDEEGVRDLVRRTLGSRGYRVLLAAQGAEALEVSAQHEAAIDLLLTDVVMPGMSGPEVAEQVVASRPATRVVFMSGHADQRVPSARRMPPDSTFLQKPFIPAQLIHAVRAALEARDEA